MANIPKVWNGSAFIEVEAAATIAPAASTSVVGIVQLTDSISSTSTTTAATPNSVKTAYDLANGAIQKTLTTTTGDIIYASSANTPARLGIGTASQVLGIAAGVPAWTTISAGGGILKYQEFTSSGSFVIPANASSSAAIVLEVLTPGNGGGGGGIQTENNNANGGNGGSGGSYGLFTGLASAYGTAGGTVTVTIGAGGAGGTAKTSGSPSSGSRGGITSFGESNFPSTFVPRGQANILSDAVQYYGDARTFGSDTVASGSALAPVNGDGEYAIMLGGIGGLSVGNTAGYISGGDSGLVGAGGGSGGGISDSNVTSIGGKGGKRYVFNGHVNLAENNRYITFGNGSSAGTAGGGAGGTATSSGGGGGGSRIGGNGGAGGAGDIGCGGGGGGVAQSGGTSGVGGAGGGGRVRVWVIG